MGHDEAVEMLGAYALDALEPDEAAVVARHLATCPSCEDELRSHREVTDALAVGVVEPPDGLWDRIARSIAEAPAMGERLQPPTLRALAAPSRHRRIWRPAVALGAAAAVVVAVLALQVVRLQHHVDHLSAGVHQIDASDPTLADVHRALADPGSRTIVLRGLGSTTASLDAVITPSGQGYVYDADLAPLSADRVYQLWGVSGDTAISYGLLGTAPRVVSFVAGAGVSTLAVTDEVAGGVVHSTQPFVAVGSVRAVN